MSYQPQQHGTQGPAPHGYNPHGPPPQPAKSNTGWKIAGALIGGLVLLRVLGMIAGAAQAPASGSTSAPVTSTAVSTTTSDARPMIAAPQPRHVQLPPEPPPALPELASEVPGFEAKLAASKLYQGLWKHEADRALLLTALSQLFVYGDAIGPTVTALQKNKDLLDVLTNLYVIQARTGSFPADFMTEMKSYFGSVSSAPRHGVWTPYKPGQVPDDCAALAAWVNRDRPEYLRELLAARKDGSVERWRTPAEPMARPYLGDEKAALEWLAMIDKLTAEEQGRLRELREEASIVRVPIATLLADYKDNEIRSDGKYKGKTIQVTGVVADVKKDILGDIFVTLGTGAEFESSKVQCFFEKDQSQAVAALSKGQNLTVRGRVSGLMMNVLVKKCVIAK